MARRYSGDPSWITARRAGVCDAKDCTDPIKAGDRIFWYPNGRKAYVGPCAVDACQDFAMAASAEAAETGAAW